MIPYLLIGVIASGTVIQTMTSGSFPELFPTSNPATNGGVPNWLGSLATCLVVLIYVFFGGMRGTAWANAFQTIVFMVLGILAFHVIATQLGGEETLLENLRKVTSAVPENKVTRMEMSKMRFFTYLLVPLSVGMFPHLFQHWRGQCRCATGDQLSPQLSFPPHANVLCPHLCRWLPYS